MKFTAKFMRHFNNVSLNLPSIYRSRRRYFKIETRKW